MDLDPRVRRIGAVGKEEVRAAADGVGLGDGEVAHHQVAGAAGVQRVRQLVDVDRVGFGRDLQQYGPQADAATVDPERLA